MTKPVSGNPVCFGCLWPDGSWLFFHGVLLNIKLLNGFNRLLELKEKLKVTVYEAHARLLKTQEG